MKTPQEYLDKDHIWNTFLSKEYPFSMRKYKKEQFVTTPESKLEKIIFVIQGDICIYGIKEDGQITPVNQLTAPFMLGDLEFVTKKNPPFFTEALSNLVCVELEINGIENQLYEDVAFLQCILQSYSQKLEMVYFMDAQAQTLEQKVIFYLQHISKEHIIDGIESSILKLRCSRRQLQRVLKKLCETNTIEKIGKGKYRLITE